MTPKHPREGKWSRTFQNFPLRSPKSCPHRIHTTTETSLMLVTQQHKPQSCEFPAKTRFKRSVDFFEVQFPAACAVRGKLSRGKLSFEKPRGDSTAPPAIAPHAPPAIGNTFSVVISQTNRLVSQERLSPGAGTSVFIREVSMHNAGAPTRPVGKPPFLRANSTCHGAISVAVSHVFEG